MRICEQFADEGDCQMEPYCPFLNACRQELDDGEAQ